MYTLEEISRSIIQSDQEDDLPDNFVAAAVKISDVTGQAYHAGLIIGLRGRYYLFHYTSEAIILGDIPQNRWYFHKVLDIITDVEVESFLVYCRVISREATPEYGFFYGGSCYTQDGKFFSESELPEIMTCVGFCLNVILGFIESDEYLRHEDWDVFSMENPDQYFINFIEQFENLLAATDVDIEILKANLRRITPDEYLASAYIEGVPISKGQIDIILPHVRTGLISKLD